MAHFSLPAQLHFLLSREVEHHYVAATTGSGCEPGAYYHLSKHDPSLPLAFLNELLGSLHFPLLKFMPDSCVSHTQGKQA